MTLCVVKFVSILVCLFFTIMHVVVSLETPTVTGPSLIEGERVSITCENRLANGNATLVWSRSDQNGVELPGIYKTEQIATTDIWLATNTHDITPDRNMNQNPSLKYRCTASFNGEEKHTDWSVFVFVKPTGPEITSSNVVAAGQVATLTCQATNANPVAVITWRIGSMDYKTTSVTTANGDSTYNVVRTLSHTFTAADNGTIVYCDMTHSVPNSVRTVSQQLIVQYAPNVTVTSTSYTVSEGQSVTLICNVTSQPSANNVAWTKDGAAIDRTSGRFTNGNSVSQPSLTITNVQATDLGTYVCTATNSIATAHSLDVTLNVKYAPKLSLSPQSTETDDGKTVTLFCGINANPPVTQIRWFQIKNNISSPLVMSGRFAGGSLTNPSNLTISFIQPIDAAAYQCEADNEGGTGKSEQVNVVVNYSPRTVTITPSALGVKEGEAIDFRCSSEAFPAATYEWRFQSEAKVISSDANLHIPSSATGNTGTFVCTASNSRGSANVTAAVDVFYQPRIQDSKSPISANTGDATLTIECNVESNPALTRVSWRKDGDVLDLTSPAGKYSGGTESSPSLVIHNVQVSDEGLYQCGVRNSQFAMVFSNTTRVTISYPPRSLRIIPAASVTLQEGVRSVLTCEADGVPQPTFVWMLNNVVQTVGRNLTFPSPGPADAGTYTCNVTNMRGSLTIDAAVVVEYSPKINLTSSSMVGDKGGNLVIEYSLQGYPSITAVEWFKDNQKLDLTTPADKYQGGTSTSGILVINQLQPSDAGSYVMRVSNAKATSNSDPIVVDVRYSPQNMRTIPLNSTVVTEGDTAVFQCLADSFPAASFRWTKGSTQLADTANLTIQVVSPDNSGQLTCTATNSKGSDKVDLKVVVNYIPRPDKAYSIVATFVGQAATLTCSTHGVPPVTKYGWKYANKTLSETGQTLTITPTSSSAAYFGVYICSATNAVGTSEDILIVLQETKPTEPPNAGASTGGGGLSSALIALIALIVAVIIVAIILVLCCCYKQGVCSKVFHKKKAGKGRVGPSGRKGMTAVETPHLTSTQKPITGYGYVSSDSRNPSSTAVSRKDVDVKYNDVNHFRTPAERKIILEDEDDRNILIPNGTGPIISCENKPYQLPPIDHTPVEDISEKKKKRKKRRRYKREEQLPHSDNQEEQRVENDYVTPAHTYSSVA